MRTRKIWAIAKTFVAFLALFLIVINLVPALLVRVPMNPVGNKKYDVIIVLGYPALEDGRPSPALYPIGSESGVCHDIPIASQPNKSKRSETLRLTI
jgi:hypothetical protein